jgi:hypothetical protein
MRLTSFRVGDDVNSGHPYPGDDRLSLVRSGVRAALARTDLPLVRKVMAVVWMAALGFAPASLVPTVAAKGLTR